MIAAAIPADEQTRLDMLRAMHILDSPREERFDRITRMARRALNVPVAAVTLIDESRQCFKSVEGMDICETSRQHSFCSHAILGEEMMVVHDATLDARFADNPLVVGGPRVRFYAGQPLSLLKRVRVGTLCVVDVKPRLLTLEEFETMRDLARMAEAELLAGLTEAQFHLIREIADRAV